MTKTRLVKTAITTILSDVVGRTQNIRKLYGYFNGSPDEFPCVMVYMKDINEERLDFHDNQVNTGFQLKLCVPLDQTSNREEMEDLRLDCIDDIMNRMRKSDAIETLGGEVFSTDFSAGEPYEELDATFPMLVTDLTLDTSRSAPIVHA